MMTTEPPSGKNEQLDSGESSDDCVMTKNECVTHCQKLTKIKVTKKTWKDRGKGKGFGYVSSKVTRLICNPSTRRPKLPRLQTVQEESRGQVDSNIMGLNSGTDNFREV